MSTTSTTAAPSSSAAEVVGGSWSVRWRRWRSLVVAAAVLAVFSATVFFLQPSTSTVDQALRTSGTESTFYLDQNIRMKLLCINTSFAGSRSCIQQDLVWLKR